MVLQRQSKYSQILIVMVSNVNSQPAIPSTSFFCIFSNSLLLITRLLGTLFKTSRLFVFNHYEFLRDELHIYFQVCKCTFQLNDMRALLGSYLLIETANIQPNFCLRHPFSNWWVLQTFFRFDLICNTTILIWDII